MARSITALYNLAVSSVGGAARISLPTENSREADTCNLWYDIVREIVLQAAPWPSAGKYKRLALLAERSNPSTAWTVNDPSPNWTYAYGVPSDMIRPRYITNFARFRMDWYAAEGEESVKALICDQEDAILHYTFDQTTPAEWDSSLYFAMAYALAAHICLPLTGKLALGQRALQLANQYIGQASAMIANQRQDTYDSVPQWIEARGYTDSGSRFNYFYPNGNALAVAELAPTGPGAVSS